MGYEKDGFAFLTDRFVHSETVLVKYFADAKCEISAEALVKFFACAESEMKLIPSRPQAFHMAKAVSYLFTIHYYFLLPKNRPLNLGSIINVGVDTGKE